MNFYLKLCNYDRNDWEKNQESLESLESTNEEEIFGHQVGEIASRCRLSPPVTQKCLRDVETATNLILENFRELLCDVDL